MSLDNTSDIRTLYVTGLPLDVKERELHILFRPFPGYEGSTLTYSMRQNDVASPVQPVAFCTFSDHASASRAKDALNGFQFDADLAATLRIEFAKSNSNAKRRSPGEGGVDQAEKRARSTDAPSMMPAAIPAYATSMTAATQARSLFPTSFTYDVNTMYGTPSMMTPSFVDPTGMGVAAAGYMITNSKGELLNPCTTLYITNLGFETTEQELTEIFARFAGFKRLRLQRTSKTGPPVCFVDFMDINCSTQALMSLQGYQVRSSDKGMKIEYAKNRMGDPSKKNPTPGNSYFGNPELAAQAAATGDVHVPPYIAQ